MTYTVGATIGRPRILPQAKSVADRRKFCIFSQVLSEKQSFSADERCSPLQF